MQRSLSSIFHNVLVDNLWISCKTNPNFLPGADNGHKIKVAGLLGQRFIEKIQNGEGRFTLDRLECPGWRRSLNNFIGSVITFFGFNWRRYLATLVTRQNCTKNAVHFAYFIIRTKKVFVSSSNFWATFLTKSNGFDCYLSTFGVTVWEVTGNFLENLEQLVESPSFSSKIYLKKRKTSADRICVPISWSLKILFLKST